MGSACSVKENNTKNYFTVSRSYSNAHKNDIITKHSSQFRDLYSKYHLFENRWTTTRIYQKLPLMVQKNFQKILERGIGYNKNEACSREKNNKINNVVKTKITISKTQTNENNGFWCDQEHFYSNKFKTPMHDISLETNEVSEMSNLLFINMNLKSPEETPHILLEEKCMAKQKLNNILGSLNYQLS